jgi:hypothetical protein
MSGVSDYLENKILDYIFRSQTFTQPTTLSVALCTSAPTDASTGATIVEASYTGYARAAANASYSGWKGSNAEVTNIPSAGTAAQTKNAGILTFGTAPSSGPTVVTHVAVLDSASIGAGNVLFYTTLTNPKTINSGDPAPTLPIDALVITVTD